MEYKGGLRNDDPLVESRLRQMSAKLRRDISHVFPFRASKIYRSSQRKSRDSQPPKKGDDLPAASLIRPQTVNESFPHSQLVAKTVSPRRLFLFTSENNANICNHSSAHLPKGFPVKTTQTVLFAIGGEAGNSEKTGTVKA